MGLAASLLTLLLVARADDACGDAAAHVAKASRDVESFFLADAEAELVRAEEAFGCGPLADPTVLGTYWLVDGAIHLVNGEDDLAKRSFAAASRVAPGQWNVNVGDQARALWERSATDEVSAGRLTVENVARRQAVAVDGAKVKAPLSLAAGLHLVQVVKGSTSTYARVVRVSAGEETVVVAPVSEEPRRRAIALLAPSVTTLVGIAGVAAASFNFASSQKNFQTYGEMYDAGQAEQANKYFYSSVKPARSLALAEMGVGVAALGVGTVLWVTF